jgi:dynein heavy chain
MTKSVSIQNDELFMKLWVNESFRVFYDRLINEEDRKWYKDFIMDLLSKNFKMSPDRDELFDNLRFGDLLKLDSPVQYYEYIGDKPKLLKTLHGALDEYNMSNSSKMNLVLFDDALEHILRIARCLKQPRGHIMLIGVGGSGKQSLLRLCTYMRGMEYRSIEITKGFNTAAFQDVMKGYMKESGIGGQGISFVMTDTQIIDETFIENLNNLLNTGEIPNLMIAEDKDEITNGVRPICNEKKIVDTIENINNLFIDRVREYLHICLCMSPVGSTLRIRCRQFPSLVNCCTLDWFSRWPEQALLYVSNEFLKELPDANDEVKSGLANMCMKIHISVEEAADRFYESLRRRIYTTPKSYLDLISLYLKKLDEQRNAFHLNKNRLAIGLKKLNDTNSNIAELKIKIEEMQPKLVQKNAELKVSLVQVNADKAIADEKEKVVSAEAEIVNKKAADAKEIADDANADLAAAKPELAAAQNAVKQLDKNSIVEIKAFAQPPDGVKFVMECVMVLLGEKTDWKNVKTVLGNPGEFLNRLLTYDVEVVSEKIWKKARDGWISKEQFVPVEVKKISTAAAALCTWAVACSRYQIVVKKIAPKKKKLAEVTAILTEAQAELQVKLDMVQAVKDKVAQLEADC